MNIHLLNNNTINQRRYYHTNIKINKKPTQDNPSYDRKNWTVQGKNSL